jgi:hypothetical protein
LLQQIVQRHLLDLCLVQFFTGGQGLVVLHMFFPALFVF